MATDRQVLMSSLRREAGRIDNYRRRFAAVVVFAVAAGVLLPVSGAAASGDPGASRDSAADLGDITGLVSPRFPKFDLDLDGGDAVHWFTFALNESRKVNLGLRQLDADADLFLEDEASVLLAESRSAGTSNEKIELDLSVGTYYVEVRAVGSGANRYALRHGTSDPAAGFDPGPDPEPVDESESAGGSGSDESGSGGPAPVEDPDSVREGAVALGDIAAVTKMQYPSYSLDGDGDAVDWFSFAISEHRFVSVGVRQLDAGVTVTLTDSGGSEIGSKSSGAKSHAMFYGTRLAGTYYLKVEAAETAANSYRLAHSTRAPKDKKVQQLLEQQQRTPLAPQQDDAVVAPGPDGDVARIAFAAASSNWALVALSPDGSRVRRLTDDSADVRDPDWSPDSSKIAYTSIDAAGVRQVFVIGSDGTGAVQLTGGPHDAIGPVWSPDGRSIAYVSGGEAAELRIVSTDGTADRLVADDYDRRDGCGPDWSPASDRIAYVGRSGTDRAVFVAGTVGDNRRQVNLLSGASGGCLDWAPDGTTLVYDKNGAIMTTNLADLTHAVLVADREHYTEQWHYASGPAWSPDGSTIAFRRMDRYRWSHVFVMDHDGSNLSQLTAEFFTAEGDEVPGVPRLNADEIAWSPDGSQLAYFAGGERANPALHVVNADGSGRVLLAGSELPKSGLRWSPDGGTLAFAALPGTELYTIRADGTERLRLTDNLYDDTDPQWSPDGTRIVYVSDDGDTEIAVMDADGGGKAQLTDNASADGAPQWSPDGTRIVYVSDDGDTEIAVMDADGGGKAQLTDNLYDDSDPQWSPDGTRIVYVSDDGDTEIAVMDADGGGKAQLTDNASADGAPQWSPDGTRIAFSSAPRRGDIEVFVMNADGAGRRQLTDGASHSFRPKWSPDGTRIAFERRLLWLGTVHTMNAEGSGQAMVAFGAHPVWSSDGTRLAYSSPRLTVAWLEGGAGSVELAHNGETPAWSPASS